MALTLIRDPRTTTPDGDGRIDIEAFERMGRELAHLRDEVPAKSEEFEDALDEIVDFQREDGSFSLVSDYRIESDSRVEYVYRPSYACCQILVKAVLSGSEGLVNGIDEFLDALRRGLAFCCERGLAGHGYESERQQVEDLRNFVSAGYLRLAHARPGLCPEFDEMVHGIVAGYERRLRDCATVFGFGTDLTLGMSEMVEAFGGDGRVAVFVYGTLMEGASRAGALEGCAHLGSARLDGHALYDLGEFPGIRPSDDGGCVLGELRMVDARHLEELDRIEGAGRLFDRAPVDVVVAGATRTFTRRAFAYVYRGEVAPWRRVPEALQPWTRTVSLRRTHVWYVAYGSCLLRERFMRYLAGGVCADNGREYEPCSDPTPPVCDVPFIIGHSVYFGNRSRSWGGAGAAFLDVDHDGIAHGRAYLITREQYEWVRDKEGRSADWYGREVNLGNLAGIPAVTFTSETPRPSNAPSAAYLDVVRRGMEEAYPALGRDVVSELLLDMCAQRRED